jgi:ATP-dependent Clp endopeptidase proteolytic subunit ClpP
VKRSQFLALAGAVPTVLAVKRDDETLQIDVLDVIGADFFGEGVTAKAIAAELDANPGVKRIAMRVNSPGGDVFEGHAIFNLLRDHGAEITVDIIGIAASMASVIALAGDTVRIASNAMMMIHDPWALAIGDQREMAAMADMLGKIRTTLLNVYDQKSPLDRGELSRMMQRETWLTASDAKEAGLVDEVVSAEPEAGEAAAVSDPRFFATLSRYFHTPEALLDIFSNSDGRQLVAAMAHPEKQETEPMIKAILAALGLSETATEAEAITAIVAMRTPDPDKYVERSELVAAAERATKAEAAMAERTKADEAAAVGTAVDDLIAGGFVEPAKRAAAIENCTILGPERYAKQFEGSTPRLDPSDLDSRDPAAGNTGVHGLSSRELAIAAKLMISPEEYAAQKQQDAQDKATRAAQAAVGAA